MIAALFVQTNGVYFNLPHVDPWDAQRDARTYAGPWPVVAHPPCERWGRYWGGAPWQKERKKLGADNDCFVAAFEAVRQFGGVLEHPEGSHAWRCFGIKEPPRDGGWVSAGMFASGHTCCVEQGHYGHLSRKATWLYSSACDLPDLVWGASAQRLPAYAVERYGYAKASRIGIMATLSSKDPRRSATPIQFRDLLISIAESANRRREAA